MFTMIEHLRACRAIDVLAVMLYTLAMLIFKTHGLRGRVSDSFSSLTWRRLKAGCQYGAKLFLTVSILLNEGGPKMRPLTSVSLSLCKGKT